MRAPTTVIDNDNVIMYHYLDEHILHHIYRGTSSDSYSNTHLVHGLQLVKQHAITGWLSEEQRLRLIPAESVRWVAETWIPQVVENGVTHWALVVPTDVDGKLQVNTVIDAFFHAGGKIRIFEDREAAMTWLMESE